MGGGEGRLPKTEACSRVEWKTMNHVMTEGVLGTAFAALLATLLPFHGAQAQPAPSCPVKIGGILPLTGSMGPVAKHIAESAQLAINHVNQGGGVKDCQVQFILRDDQGQSTVGVDAAKYLIEVEGVKSLTGTVSSGVSLPILTAAAVPSKMPMISVVGSKGFSNETCPMRPVVKA